MKITLESDGRKPMKAEVDNTNPIVGARQAAMQYAIYTGSPITAVDDEGHRIVTVTIEYHDE